MGLLDDLKKTVAERAAKESARQTGRAFTAAVGRLAGEFLDDAEQALEDARAARGLDAEDEGAPEAEEQPAAATPSYSEQRRARQAAAAEELARLKAERAARIEAGPRADQPKKTL
jgi:hypothetical protein